MRMQKETQERSIWQGAPGQNEVRSFGVVDVACFPYPYRKRETETMTETGVA